MQEPSVFTKIIKGEIPCYKVYEDNLTFAFLDIKPNTLGHTLVIPKRQVDKLYDLPDEDYQAVMMTVKKVALRLQHVLQPPRVGIQVQGFDVPHAHVHVLAISSGADLNPDNAIAKPSDDEMADVARRLAF